MAKKKTAAPAANEADAQAKAEAKQAKKKARLEAIKNRPAGQRPNSRQIDVIDVEGAGKILNYGCSCRKTGTLVTSVALNKEGEIVSTSVVFIPGTKVKSKKGHGMVVPGVAGVGKGKAEEDIEGDEAENEEDED